MELRVTLEGGKRVATQIGSHLIMTDQPATHGGGDSAPAPYDLFMASIATCAGFYALQFVTRRGLPAEGLALSLEPLRQEGSKRVDTVRLTVDLPSDFPEKYRKPLERAIDQCTVKRHILEPPAFDVVLR